MVDDVLPNLLKSVRQDFEKYFGESDVVTKAFAELQAKKATYKTVNEFAIEVGQLLSLALAGSVTSDKLPDGKMYYNIAKRLLYETLGRNYELISGYARDVQQILNEQSKINVKVQRPQLNQDKIDGLVNRLDSEPVFDDVKWLLGEPIVNFSQSIVDDSIKANSEFQYRAGLTPRIIRKASGHCCDWCQQVVGIYKYPDVPKDIWRRHGHCKCTVDYDPKTGKIQDVWSKTWRKTDQNDKIEKRKKIDKSVKMSKSRKRALELGIERNQIKKQLFKKSEDNIIKEVSGGDMTSGSCSSAAFAYIGNKAGFKVLDFRGGDSCNLFSTNGSIIDIANLENVNSTIVNHGNDFIGAKQLLSKIDNNKEYYLATGSHAAIIKKTEKEFQYLELQHQNTEKNGFKKLDYYTLQNRFGCKKSHSSYGRKYEVPNILIEAESLGKNEEFQRILNFINTPKDKQQKGSNGHVK
ncbi:hypothetical protein OPT59_07690 [Streptococcus dysgalactiae subsp. equisimilis]|uniref:Gp35 n=1 Tax=Streptococcus dysgalactiae subsp. equisimilis TaxID=119602 RepID=A0AB38XZU7_STREQ|nr:hypothetical protein [Streptococcus dysgalactiae]WHM78524.1 hypothetical protein OPT59_07690 [Streptococcus dysgalactiae subsp. equisimilis]